jgi:hypothetical protein
LNLALNNLLHSWWAWQTVAGILAMGAIGSAMRQDERGLRLPIIVGAVTSIGALLCGAIGVVMLVRWMMN